MTIISNDLRYNNSNNYDNNSVLDHNCIIFSCFPLLLFLFPFFSPAGNIANNLRWPVAADHNYILPQSCVELGQVWLLWCHRLCITVCAARFNDEKHLRGENGSCHSGTRESNQNNTMAVTTFLHCLSLPFWAWLAATFCKQLTWPLATTTKPGFFS